MDKKYLRLLKMQYPSRQAVSREIINLSAITNLPKGTEYFMSDLHGEYEAFLHILNNCSGVIKEKVDMVFSNTMSVHEKQEICTLIYYPKEKLALLENAGVINNDWYKNTLESLLQVAKLLSSKYTRSKVRKAMPIDFAYIIDELIHAQEDEDSNQLRYHAEILNTIIALNNADEFIIALSDLIKRLAVDHLHIVGDIYDRGGKADRIVDLLLNYHSIDIEWGNHDILWMGAACGCEACVLTVLHNNLKYGNTEILEHAYGISLRPLMIYAMEKYQCGHPVEAAYQAVRVMLFKAEGQLVKQHPEYQMDERMLLGKIDWEQKVVTIDGVKEPLLSGLSFPTVDWENPYDFSEEEEKIVKKLVADFMTSTVLKKHMDFLYAKGSMYRIYNGNLLFHGCIPMNEEGNFDFVDVLGEKCHGRRLLDRCDEVARSAYYDRKNQDAIDFMWYLWIGAKSPLCGRKIKTFEREFVESTATHAEPANPYYSLYYKKSVCEQILREFGLYSRDSHIINGHTPVYELNGEKPIRANGRLFVIDGGFCQPMNKKTGIAGYTLIFNSHFFRLKAHTPFTNVEDAINNNADIDDSENEIVPLSIERLYVRDTDNGAQLLQDIEDLKSLYKHYDEL